jgi:Tfp pilus assembly protein PilO
MGRATQLILVISVCFLVLFGALAAATYSKYQQNDLDRIELTQLQQELAGYEAKIATRDARLALKAAIDEANKEVIQLLPRFSETQSVDKALEQLNRYRSKARLELGPTVSDEPRPATGELGEGVIQTTFTMNLEGTFARAMKFLSSLERSPNLLRVDELKLTPTGRQDEGRPMLRIFVKISAFHYKV